MNVQGNDFVVIDNTSLNLKHDSLKAKKLSDRRFGIGCDQLVLIDYITEGNAVCSIYNSDGSFVSMCANGIGCVAKLLLVDNLSDIFINVSGNKNKSKCIKRNNKIMVNIGNPSFVFDNEIHIKVRQILLQKDIMQYLEDDILPSVICVGNNHIIIWMKEIEYINLSVLAERFKNVLGDVFNIHIGKIIDSFSIKLLSYERGVGETLSCGSGAYAAVECLRAFNFNVADKVKVFSGLESFVFIEMYNQESFLVICPNVNFTGQFPLNFSNIK